MYVSIPMARVLQGINSASCHESPFSNGDIEPIENRFLTPTTESLCELAASAPHIYLMYLQSISISAMNACNEPVHSYSQPTHSHALCDQCQGRSQTRLFNQIYAGSTWSLGEAGGCCCCCYGSSTHDIRTYYTISRSDTMEIALEISRRAVSCPKNAMGAAN